MRRGEMPSTFVAEAGYPNGRTPGRAATVALDLATVHPGAGATAGPTSTRAPDRRAAYRKERRTPTTIERKPVMTDTTPVLVIENFSARGKKARALARPSSGSSSLAGSLTGSSELAREAS